MANPSSRQGLIDYCLRRLGHPVIEINIDDDQIEDRIDEALQYYQEFHFDAVELVYLQEQVTASTLRLQTLVGMSLSVGETITGVTSGATCFVHALSTANTVKVKGVSGTFVAGESFTTSYSGQTGSLAATNVITLGNYDNRYFDMSDAVTGIVRVLPFSSRTRGIDLFDVRYQILMNDLYSLQSTDLIYYTQVKTQLQLINDLLVGQKPIRFNRHQNRLHVDMSWGTDVDVGDYMVVECYRILDPDTFTDVYGDEFLKRYATALLKQQWGVNLKKFEGVQLPGGVTLNGQQIFNEATDEIKELREELQLTYQLPIDFFTG
jgi:hypothetical protein